MSSLKTNFDVDIIQHILGENAPAFAMVHRPETTGDNCIEVLLGDIHEHTSLSDIKVNPVNENIPETHHDKLILLPYQQIAERGMEAKDDNTPLVEMDIQIQETISKKHLMASIPDYPLQLANAGFNISDDEYAKVVESVLKNEIGRGTGASFVIQRSYVADLENYSIAAALSIYKRLLAQESGSYWTFIVHTGDRTLIGATPERHISLNDGIAIMNPISGTFRYPSTGPKLEDIKTFLSNKKEIEELYMVVDEELKMMARVCDEGGIVEGPNLKEMARLAHTEYYIKGKSSLGPIEILKETMFAPSVTGSPQESAASIINQYEPEGRGYYSGVIALIGQENGQRFVDSGILIRTADINESGQLKLSVGATLVRDSDPFSEAEETKAKASGLLSAIGVGNKPDFQSNTEINKLLSQRNDSISDFWLKDRSNFSFNSPQLAGKQVLIVDAEDTFTSMIDHQLRFLGCETTVCRYDEPYSFTHNYDFVVMGPGPGDPRDLTHPKIAVLNRDIKDLLDKEIPFLAICLSHQVLSSQLGLNIIRRDEPNQGVQKTIDLFGQNENVGFYNTFAAKSNYREIRLPRGLGIASISKDSNSGEVHAISGSNFCSVQFHPESILTIDGVQIFERLINQILNINIDLENVA